MNKKLLLKTTGLTAALLITVSLFSCGKKSETAVESVTSAEDYVSGSSIRVPLIAWGADLITIYANGSSDKTVKGSLFDRAGMNIELYREDNFNRQVDAYVKGVTPFLRGTMGMINMASEKINFDTRTRPVLIFQHSWSAGGDALVVKPGINSVADLRGKSVAIQKSGPHVDYFLKLIKDAGLKPSEITIVWTDDLIGAKGDTPMSKIYKSDIQAAFVIIPDALALTSNGTVGTGAEESVKGARILLSTKTANRIISDVYAVRKDYFDKNRDQVVKFVQSLLLAEEAVKDMFKNKSGDEYKKLLSSGGKLLLDDQGATADVAGMYFDAEMAGFDGNVKFFTDMNFPRNFKRLTTEIQGSLTALKLIARKSELLDADFDYNSMKGGLRYANITAPSRFDPSKAAAAAEKLSRTDSSLFSFEIYFEPNQNSFPASKYSSEFDRVIDFASTYGGAIITVEGHSDTMAFLRKQKEGADQLMLKKIEQSAKNLSFSRAGSVRDEIVKYASSKGITLDSNQLSVIGHGISSPKFKIPRSQNEWKQNMRVQFKIIQVEAEEDVFKPL